jgi:hypothetical protein
MHPLCASSQLFSWDYEPLASWNAFRGAIERELYRHLWEELIRGVIYALMHQGHFE